MSYIPTIFLVLWKGAHGPQNAFAGAVRVEADSHDEAAEKRLNMVSNSIDCDGSQMMTIKLNHHGAPLVGLAPGSTNDEYVKIHNVRSQKDAFAHYIERE